MIAVGIDPGTGTKSPTGIFIFNMRNRNIVLFDDLTATGDQRRRIRLIAKQVEEILLPYTGISKDLNVFMECFVMRGKGGEVLSRLTGALTSAVPEAATFQYVYNTTVKKIVGGNGKADKSEVALGVLDYFSENKRSEKLIEELILDEHWDVLDAAAIAIAGLEGGGRDA